MDRREFLKKSALISVALPVAEMTRATELISPAEHGASQPIDEQPASDGALIISAPMLQNYAEDSIGIAFAVSDLANGFVEIGKKADLSDARRVMSGGYRMAELSDRVAQVRITGLEPSTTYYYRIGAERISYKGGYNMKNLGSETDSHIYHFTTAGKKANAHFCVINDTHVKWVPFGRAIEKIAAVAPSCVVWNGDASNVEETIEAQMRIFLTPDISQKDYAAQTPYLFCTGNHDFRGMANRHLERVWMTRQPEERSVRDWDLGRNFALRMGEIAMIGLDTGEDKLDTNPKFAGIFKMKEYREAQTLWLADVLKRHDIATAPFLVAFCHIPLFDPNPKHNPGDVAPDDRDDRYSTDYAMWQRTCAGMWTPLLTKARCQLLITAHQHRYQYHPSTSDRPWAQIVGGGPEMGKYDGVTIPKEFPTVIEGKVQGGLLHITVHNLVTGAVQEEMDFKPRRK